jgi:hypothetical protein
VSIVTDTYLISLLLPASKKPAARTADWATHRVAKTSRVHVTQRTFKHRIDDWLLHQLTVDGATKQGCCHLAKALEFIANHSFELVWSSGVCWSGSPRASVISARSSSIGPSCWLLHCALCASTLLELSPPTLITAKAALRRQDGGGWRASGDWVAMGTFVAQLARIPCVDNECEHKHASGGRGARGSGTTAAAAALGSLGVEAGGACANRTFRASTRLR